MDPLVIWAAGAGGLGLFGLGLKWRSQRNLHRVARRFGLTMNGRRQVYGVVGAFTVEIDARPTEAGPMRTRLRVSPLPDSLSFRAQGAPSLGDDGPLIDTGDAAFDAQVRVYGPPRIAFALLDMDTRDTLASAVVTGLQLREGALRWMCLGAASFLEINAAITIALEAARALSRPSSIGAVIHLALTDSLPVALRALDAVPPGPDRDALDEAVIREGVDARAIVAAQRQGADAVGRVARDAGKPDAIRARALRWLAANAPRQADAVARACMDGPEMTRVALAIIGQAGAPVSLSALTDLAEHDRSMIPQVLRLALLHGPDAAPLLLTYLGDVDPEIARVAAAGLGQIGDVSAVPALRLRARFHLSAPSVRDAVNAAIAAIHARLAPPGGLSMPKDEGGQVSFADQAGALSPAADADDARREPEASSITNSSQETNPNAVC